MNKGWQTILDTCERKGEERYRRKTNERHFVLQDDEDLYKICRQLKNNSAYLVTMVAADERRLEDGCFKLYYVFSHQKEDHFLILEYHLRGEQYASIREYFEAALPFEYEICEFFGLEPLSEQVSDGFLLHRRYPPSLTPLRRDRTTADLQRAIADGQGETRESANRIESQAGELFFPVGPIHAGVIEAGQFRFRIAGERIDDLKIQLGYKHKGVEKLFQTKFLLADGWQLAERISGDSSFAHSLAYCRAVEDLADISPPRPAIYLRGLLLELERLYNHIGDSGMIAHDVAFNLVASEIAVLREWLLRLNNELTGHRLLRGVNRPGGIILQEVVNQTRLNEIVAQITRKQFQSLDDLVEAFLALGNLLLNNPAFRDRAINTGRLSKEQALRLGATGLTARASGLIKRDFRAAHPWGVYQLEPDTVEMVQMTTPPKPGQQLKSFEMRGDVLSRLRLRIFEVKTSIEVIRHILTRLKEFPADEALQRPSVQVERAIKETGNFGFAMGYAEGWRGDIIYWLMKDRFNRIFRCKVRDPSFLNWPAMQQAVLANDPDDPEQTENILADFPLINKSFNLSYSGHDL